MMKCTLSCCFEVAAKLAVPSSFHLKQKTKIKIKLPKINLILPEYRALHLIPKQKYLIERERDLGDDCRLIFAKLSVRNEEGRQIVLWGGGISDLNIYENMYISDYYCCCDCRFGISRKIWILGAGIFMTGFEDSFSLVSLRNLG